MSSARTRPSEAATSISSESILRSSGSKYERSCDRASSGGRSVRNSGMELAQPECQSKKVGSETEDSQRGGRQESPICWRAQRHGAHQENLKESKRKCQKGRPDQRQGDS